ncbi:hypothetical protein NDU88_000324 [Pleurodeles waltl]|uniref:Uncharacterized protein n=1 Tax=Pleurodeles waltl TaxID=8319 RepID=A0AAV7TF46_PLEWA|nr:hypothetical protein NDU88_000324 [Pleurodeles waltl]
MKQDDSKQQTVLIDEKTVVNLSDISLDEEDKANLSLDTATLNPEADRETDSLIGRLQPPRDLTWVKTGIPSFPEEKVVSWNRNTPELVNAEDWTDREDAERGATETSFRTSVTTVHSGAEESRGITEDRWPRGAYA